MKLLYKYTMKLLFTDIFEQKTLIKLTKIWESEFNLLLDFSSNLLFDPLQQSWWFKSFANAPFEQKKLLINLFQPNVAFHIETSNLFWLVSIWNATLSRNG